MMSAHSLSSDAITSSRSECCVASIEFVLLIENRRTRHIIALWIVGFHCLSCLLKASYVRRSSDVF